jgi:hypothetical protein
MCFSISRKKVLSSKSCKDSDRWFYFFEILWTYTNMRTNLEGSLNITFISIKFEPLWYSASFQSARFQIEKRTYLKPSQFLVPTQHWCKPASIPPPTQYQGNYYHSLICNYIWMTRWHVTFKLLLQSKVYKFIHWSVGELKHVIIT